VTRKTANAVKAAEANVQRWAKAKGEQAAKLADAEAARDPVKAEWIELCLAADVDGADNSKDIAAAEAKMNGADLAIERARLSLAECDKRWTAAKERLAEATYHDAMAEIERLDALDAGLVADYDAAARELKRQAVGMRDHAKAKQEQTQRAQPWAAMTGAPNPRTTSPMFYEMTEARLYRTYAGMDLLENLIAKRQAAHAE